MKPKILYVTPGIFDKGGISRYNRYQIAALRDLFGNESLRVYSLVGPGADTFEEDIHTHWHGGENNVWSRIRMVLVTLAASIFWRPDYIVVTHVNFSGLYWLYAKLAGAISILDVYGQEVWAKLSSHAIYGFRHVDHVISDCHATADYIVKEGIRPPNDVVVIWDCVDLKQFVPKPEQNSYIRNKYNLPDRENHFIIMTLGRLMINASYKGYQRLLAVFSEIVKKYPEAVLVFAGRGDLVPVLQKEADEFGVSSNVFFTGMIPEDDMAGLYSYGHLFSLVSHCDKDSGEGIPLTPLEAMACRVPILVGNQDGSREAVIDNRNGKVVDPFALDTHREFIEDLITDKDKRERMAEEALKVAHEYFSYPDFREKHRVFFNGIIKRDE